MKPLHTLTIGDCSAAELIRQSRLARAEAALVRLRLPLVARWRRGIRFQFVPGFLVRLNRRMVTSALVLLAGTALATSAPRLDVERLANAIYRAEGGARASHPYGVESVRVANAVEARRVCVNSIRNNWRRWQAAGAPGEFIPFMARRYCPLNQRVWARNVTFFYQRQGGK